MHARFLSCLPRLLALSFILQTIMYTPISVRFFFVGTLMIVVIKVGEEVNDLSETLSLQVISPNLLLGR